MGVFSTRQELIDNVDVDWDNFNHAFVMRTNDPNTYDGSPGDFLIIRNENPKFIAPDFCLKYIP